jgi:hypothetical protein
MCQPFNTSHFVPRTNRRNCLPTPRRSRGYLRAGRRLRVQGSIWSRRTKSMAWAALRNRRIVTYTVYNDANHEVRTNPAWNSSTNLPTGPISVYHNNLAGDHFEPAKSVTQLLQRSRADGQPDADDQTSRLGRWVIVDPIWVDSPRLWLLIVMTRTARSPRNFTKLPVPARVVEGRRVWVEACIRAGSLGFLRRRGRY